MSRKTQKRKSIHTSSMFGELPDVLPDVQTCEWPECENQGEHRAPSSRDDLNTFRWFCLDHIRLFNKSWNYYEGMSDEQIEADLRDDTSWNRPSWPFSGLERQLYYRKSFSDMNDFDGVFSKSCKQEKESTFQSRHEPSGPEAEAIAILDLTPPVTTADIKQRYKQLVKRHHPDANGGDKAAEEKFKKILQAYETLTSDPPSSQ